jgi:hypothetical protein
VTTLHTTEAIGVGSQARPPADGGQTTVTRGLNVPAVGTLTQEGSEASGTVPDTATNPPNGGLATPSGLDPWASASPGPCNTVRRDIQGVPRRYLCDFPDPNTHKFKRWRCPECGWRFKLNEVVNRWYVQ